MALLAVDLDGTLTDGTTWWAGPERGWVQRYNVRDGEAILRLKSRIFVVPLSANKTSSARARCELLGLETQWLGVDDKMAALREMSDRYGVAFEQVGYVADGASDAPVLRAVGVGMAVADAHPKALAAADFVLKTAGGERVMEEIELRYLETTV